MYDSMRQAVSLVLLVEPLGMPKRPKQLRARIPLTEEQILLAAYVGSPELGFVEPKVGGRAFAAELLAPIEEIKSMLADKHDTITIAEEFGVSTVLIDRQIENAPRISEACSKHP
jgi:hypothetical protein